MGKKQIDIPAKLKIRKGDLVKVIAGDSKGSQGKILEVILEVEDTTEEEIMEEDEVDNDFILI